MSSPRPCTPYQNNFAETLPFSNTNMCALLASDTALSWTVPGVSTQKYRVRFRSSYTTEIWVSYNGTAAVPSAGTASTVAFQELLPLEECRYVNGGDTLSFIAATGTPSVSAYLLLVQQ
jgi:hypothetical protein